jgi:hypothetical protein
LIETKLFSVQYCLNDESYIKHIYAINSEVAKMLLFFALKNTILNKENEDSFDILEVVECEKG